MKHSARLYNNNHYKLLFHKFRKVKFSYWELVAGNISGVQRYNQTNVLKYYP